MIDTKIPTHAVYDKEALQKMLGLSATTILREVRAGRLRACKRAGRYFFLAEHVNEWLRKGEVNGNGRHDDT